MSLIPSHPPTHCRLIASLPVHTQQLLVLLFGTFRVIASNAARADTGMTSEALGVSVAPSFFHTCVSDGKTARMEDVLKFKVTPPPREAVSLCLQYTEAYTILWYIHNFTSWVTAVLMLVEFNQTDGYHKSIPPSY